MGNVWSDVPPINSQAKERVGYPTQKPLALLDRIIAASSNPGDVVLGSVLRLRNGVHCGPEATTPPVGRHRHQPEGGRTRPPAHATTNCGMFYDGAHRTDIPKRTDLGRVAARTIAPKTGSGYTVSRAATVRVVTDHFEARHLEVDHIIARRKGGTDHTENLQLLCGNCNRIKGHRGMAYLRTKLQLTGR